MNLNRLDHIRFFACVWVIFRHFRHWGIEQNSYHHNFVIRHVSNFFTNGQLGVDVFFVLSAFLFTVLIKDREIYYHKFIYNRILRIFPLLFFAFLFITSSETILLGDFVTKLLTFSYASISSTTFFGAIWTLGVEFRFYFLLPIILMICKNSVYGKYESLLGLILILILLKIMFVPFYSKTYLLFYGSLLGRLDQFLIGIIFGNLFLDGAFNLLKNKILANSCLIISVLCLCVYISIEKFVANDDIFLAVRWAIQALLMACIIISYLYSNLFSDQFFDKVFIWLGSLTYSIYLFHETIGNSILKYINFPVSIYGTFVNVIFIVLPLSILFAMLTQRYIEAPFLKLKTTYYRYTKKE